MVDYVKTTRQEIEVKPISDVAVTAIFHDDVEGDYYRDIILFGETPEPVAGTTVVDTSTTPTMLKIRIRANTVDPLKITVPQDEF